MGRKRREVGGWVLLTVVGGEERRGSNCLLELTRNIAHFWEMNLEGEGATLRQAAPALLYQPEAVTRLISGPSD